MSTKTKAELTDRLLGTSAALELVRDGLRAQRPNRLPRRLRSRMDVLLREIECNSREAAAIALATAND